MFSSTPAKCTNLLPTLYVLLLYLHFLLTYPQFDFESGPLASFNTKGHQLSVTYSTASDSAKYLFTAGKEGTIIQWDLFTGKKLHTIYKVKPNSPSPLKGKAKATAAFDPSVEGHTKEVYGLAISGDGKLLATAGADRRVGIWDVEKGTWVKGFAGNLGHKDVVSVCSPCLTQAE